MRGRATSGFSYIRVIPIKYPSVAHSTESRGGSVPGSVAVSGNRAPIATQIYDGSAQLAQNMEDQKTQEEWEKETGDQIKKVIKDEMFRTLKFIRADNIMARAQEWAFDLQDYQCMRQFSDAQKAKFKADWVKNYGHLVSKMLNTHRGEVQQAVRKVCKKYWKAKKALPSSLSLERILKRELSPNIKGEL